MDRTGVSVAAVLEPLKKPGGDPVLGDPARYRRLDARLWNEALTHHAGGLGQDAAGHGPQGTRAGKPTRMTTRAGRVGEASDRNSRTGPRL